MCATKCKHAREHGLQALAGEGRWEVGAGVHLAGVGLLVDLEEDQRLDLASLGEDLCEGRLVRRARDSSEENLQTRVLAWTMKAGGGAILATVVVFKGNAEQNDIGWALDHTGILIGD